MKGLVEKIQNYKVLLVISSMLFFSFVYMFVSDDEWFGVNKMKDIVKDEVAREKVEEDIEIKQQDTINFQNIEGFFDFNKDPEKTMNMDDEINTEIGKAEDKVESESLTKSPFEMYFNRLYFSIVTGCLLGYGDIYPESMRLKALVSIQSLLTIIIIVL